MSPRHFSKTMHSPYFQSEHYRNSPAGKVEQKVENFFYWFFHIKLFFKKKRFRKIRQQDCLNFENFDKQYNINTKHIVIDLPNGSGKKGPGIEHNSDRYPISNGYQVCTLKHMDQICKDLSHINNIINYEFIDIGSGKGKILFYNILKNRPFASYKGIEIDEDLHKDAINNLQSTNIDINKNVEFLNLDAFEYSPENRETVYFMYRPFSDQLHKDFFAKNKDVFTKSPTVIVLMCPYPGVQEYIIEELGFIKYKERFSYVILKNQIF